MTPDGRPDMWEDQPSGHPLDELVERILGKPNLAMDKEIEAFAYRARLGAKVPIWQTVLMPMSKPGYRGLDLLECPDESKSGLPIENVPHHDDCREDELMEILAGHPPRSRYPMLKTARNQKPNTPDNWLRYMTLDSIMASPHHSDCAAAMEAQRVRGDKP